MDRVNAMWQRLRRWNHHEAPKWLQATVHFSTLGGVGTFALAAGVSFREFALLCLIFDSAAYVIVEAAWAWSHRVPRPRHPTMQDLWAEASAKVPSEAPHLE